MGRFRLFILVVVVLVVVMEAKATPLLGCTFRAESQTEGQVKQGEVRREAEKQSQRAKDAKAEKHDTKRRLEEKEESKASDRGPHASCILILVLLSLSCKNAPNFRCQTFWKQA